MKKLTSPQIFWTLALSLLLLMVLSLALQNRSTPPDVWQPLQAATLLPTFTPTAGWWALTATPTPTP